jgi:hypothetical protein
LHGQRKKEVELFPDSEDDSDEEDELGEPEPEIRPLRMAEERRPEAGPEDFWLERGRRLRIAGKCVHASRRSR